MHMVTIPKVFAWVTVFTAGVLFAATGVTATTPPSEPSSEEQTAPSVPPASPGILSDRVALESYIRAYGIKKTMVELHGLSVTHGSCHNAAHHAGHIAYELFGEQSFRECSAECHSGCYHGATEAYFHKNGIANLKKHLALLCNKELNGFFTHQCLHGIGHGLMAWTDYDLPQALKSCDLLDRGQDSCWTGVFMENIVAKLGEKKARVTKYLSNDPAYPCNDPKLDERYRGSCWFLQTSRMLQLFGTNFAKVAAVCAKAPASYQYLCFGSMGREVGGKFRGNPKGAIMACTNAPLGTMREACLMGAVQDSFWDPRGQDAALGFCKLLSDPKEERACYGTIFRRAREVLSGAPALQSFCAKVERAYQEECRTKRTL